MPKKLFRIEPHTHIDKTFKIEGPYFTVFVDYDDVNHREVDATAKKVVSILNANWEKS